MNAKEIIEKDQERQKSGFYDNGIGKLLCDKWIGTFNRLPVPVQQNIMDYAEAVALEFQEQSENKITPIEPEGS